MLYIVGTPLGNLGDITLRALETLTATDFIAAEDTRVSRKLLTHYGIHKPLLSYHAHNREESGVKILSRLEAGQTGALITDAGMPCISDPGAELIALCRERGITVSVVPGASALIGAAVLCHFPLGRFCFEGFLSVTRKRRFEHLESIKHERRTMIFYEAPHKLLYTLRDMREVLGERRVTIVRELTKLNEEVLCLTLSEALSHFESTAPRGEFVLAVEGCTDTPEPVTIEQAVELAKSLRDSGLSASEAAKQAASETGIPRSALYKACLSGRE